MFLYKIPFCTNFHGQLKKKDFCVCKNVINDAIEILATVFSVWVFEENTLPLRDSSECIVKTWNTFICSWDIVVTIAFT